VVLTEDDGMVSLGIVSHKMKSSFSFLKPAEKTGDRPFFVSLGVGAPL
jgi:hypothetical protein